MAAHPPPAAAQLRSLADATPGTLVEVVHILFGSLRERYAAAGIRAGTLLRLRCRSAERVLVELAGGAVAEVEAVHAPFVEVRPHAADAGAWRGRPAARPLAAAPTPDLPPLAGGPQTHPHPR